MSRKVKSCRTSGVLRHVVRPRPDARLERSLRSDQETSDRYRGVVTYLCAVHRVIICRDGLQWILQRRKNGGAERPWRAVGYLQTREALVRLCATSCGPLDPIALAALTALPAIIGQEGTP